MGFLRSLLTGRRAGAPRGGMIPAGEVHTPWDAPGKRKMHRDPQSGTTKRAFRGLALGNRSAPDETIPNQAHWIQLPEGWAREFVYSNQPLYVHSTNVEFAQYWLERKELYVQFLSGSGGTYSNVTEEEAIDFTQAGSKGGWVIDVLIGRANLKDHACWHGGPSNKPYHANYKPADMAMIPEAEITLVGDNEPLIPDREVVIESPIRKGHEDVFRDKLRRQGELADNSPSLHELNAQRKAMREFNRRLLNG